MDLQINIILYTEIASSSQFRLVISIGGKIQCPLPEYLVREFLHFLKCLLPPIPRDRWEAG